MESHNKLKASTMAVVLVQKTEEEKYEKDLTENSFFFNQRHAIEAAYLTCILALTDVGIKLQELHIPIVYDPLRFSYRAGTTCDGVAGLTTT
eukprot:6395380-Prymnesium_polylepis.1